MRIAMISYHTCPRASHEGKETGGMEVYVMGVSRALAALGHQVDVFTRSHEANDPLIINEIQGLRVIHLPAGPRMQVQKNRLKQYIPEYASRLYQFIKNDDFPYDVVHAHYYMSGIVAQKVFSAEKSISVHKASFIMTFHTLGLMKNLVARDTLERETQFRIKAEFNLMKQADSIVASSEIDKEYMQYLYDVPPEKIRIVYPGIDLGLFHPVEKNSARDHIGATQEHKIVLFVGRVEPLKGIDTLLYAMKILKKKHPEQIVCLWIVGGDTSEPSTHWPKTLRELSKLRAMLGISEDSVHFVGRQLQSELPFYYNAADVVVMPSHYESFGMSALEAMACGVPVITTNVAGITSRIDAKHTSLITSVNNPLLLASQIEHLLSNELRASQLAEAIRVSVEGFTWSHVAKDMLTVYSSHTSTKG